MDWSLSQQKKYILLFDLQTVYFHPIVEPVKNFFIAKEGHYLINKHYSIKIMQNNIRSIRYG